MCYDKEKNGKESYNHGKWMKNYWVLLQSAVPLQVLFIILKNLKKMWMKISTMILKMKTSILTMIFNVDRGYVDLNAGKVLRKKQTMQKKQRPAKILWMRMLTKGKKISSADTD